MRGINKNLILKPIISYPNAKESKFLIYFDNREKSGIYRWINKITSECYIGSTKDLTKRLRHYYSLKYLHKKLLKNKSSLIYKAIIEYDLSSFSLDILEYCPLNELLIREQYYIDSLKPEYNILKIAGSVKGYKHNNYIKERKNICITDINTNTNLIFLGNKKAMEYLNISKSTLIRYKNLKILYKNRYKISNV